jgi:hypothetical protein
MGMKAAAVDELLRAFVAHRGLRHQLAVALEHAEDPMRRADIAAVGANLFRVGGGNFLVVDDSGFRHVERFYAGGLGLDLAQPLRPDDLQPLKSVGPGVKLLGRASLRRKATTTLPQFHRAPFWSQNFISVCARPRSCAL